MKHRLGNEMRQLIIWATTMTLLLLILVVGYFMIDVAVTSNNNIEKNKQLAIDQSVVTLREMAENIGGMSMGSSFVNYINLDYLAQLAAGGMDKMFPMMTDLAVDFYPIEYVGEVMNGEVLWYQTADGEVIDTSALPAKPQDATYTTFDNLSGKEGFYISVYYPINGLPGYSGLETNFIVDRTQEIGQIEEYFTDQRNSQLLRLGIVALVSIILFALLCTLGLRFLVGKFVMGPINELNEEAEGIITGTFEGEVPYDKDSTFAPIQGLLRSGQKVLNKMDNELGG